MIDRRNLMSGAAALGLAAAAGGLAPRAARAQAGAYQMPEWLLPRRVVINDAFAPGELHLVPDDFLLYWTEPGGTAVRYGVGVGRAGLYESGEFYVGAKKEWPSWTPTPDMIAREPEHYGRWKDGMPGGPENPLGARALYLFTPEKGDTYLRIHGTNDPRTVGTAVSNGCARLANDHVVDLYNRVPIGTRVVLYPKSSNLS